MKLFTLLIFFIILIPETEGYCQSRMYDGFACQQSANFEDNNYSEDTFSDDENSVFVCYPPVVSACLSIEGRYMAFYPFSFKKDIFIKIFQPPQFS
jgi:hypothetical protein